MTTATIPRLEQVFRALADDVRLRILGLVASGEVCVCDIHAALDVPQPTASRHLAYLRRAGLVSARRDGQWMHYRLEMPADPALASVLRAALDALGRAPRVGTDRKRLSRATAVPLRVIQDAAAACCRVD
jgi:ArsR family transcriptional regulator